MVRAGGKYIKWTIFIIYGPASDATAVPIIQPPPVYPGRLLLVKKKQIRWSLIWVRVPFIFVKFERKIRRLGGGEFIKIFILFLALRRHLFVAFCAHQTRYFSKKHECPVSTNDLLKVQISINIPYFHFLKRAITSCITCNSIPAMTTRTNQLWNKDQLLLCFSCPISN